MSVILDTEGRGAVAEIFADLEQRLEVPEDTEEWLAALVAWMVDDHASPRFGKQNDADFADALQLTWVVGSRLEAELGGRFKKIVPVASSVFPFTAPGGELSAGITDNVKLEPMSEDVREITCALAAEMLKADPDHDTLFIHLLIRKITSSKGANRYDTRFATGKTA